MRSLWLQPVRFRIHLFTFHNMLLMSSFRSKHSNVLNMNANGDDEVVFRYFLISNAVNTDIIDL